MITLLDAARWMRVGNAIRPILLDVSVDFGQREKVGILAASGTGKSTIARMLAGIEAPDSGQILRRGWVSWPLGFAGGFHPELTLRKNYVLLSDILGLPLANVIAFCCEFGQLEAALDQPAKSLSPAARLAAAYCFSLATPCQTYVADDVIGFGEGLVRKKTEAMLKYRLESAGLVFISKNPSQLSEFCDRFFVLLGGKLVPCASPDIGAKALSLMGSSGVTTGNTLGEMPEAESHFP